MSTARPRLALVLAWMLGAALLAAACGDSGGTEGSTAATESSAQGEATAPADAAIDAATQTEAAEAGTAAASPLAGEVVTFVVGVGPGGGYDAYARLLAPFLAEELEAEVIVQNSPGAGGLLALNQLLAAEPNGQRIMLANGSGVAGSALAEAEGVEFELDDLAYIGRVYAGDKVVATGADSSFQTIEDLTGTGEPFRFGSSGPGASTYVEPTVLTALLDWNATIISGFAGSAEVNTALASGDVDGLMVDLDSELPLIEAGDARPLLIVGDDRAEAVPDAPALLELELDPQQQELAESLLNLLELGRVVVAHPDTPPDLVEALDAAFGRILTDPEVLAAAEEQERPIEYLSGAEVVEVVDAIQDAPPEFLELLEAGY